MDIIFPSRQFEISEIDPQWVNEYNLAKKFGNVHLYDFGENRLSKSLKSAEKKTSIRYHGWMFKSDHYREFYQKLLDKNFELTNSPEQYDTCHHLPGWYDSIKEFTPLSVTSQDLNLRSMIDLVLGFQEKYQCDVIIKDFVSSLKHDWDDACFISKNAYSFEVAKIVANFLAIKNAYGGIEGGFVVRKFEELERLCGHPKSRMPLSVEYRSFVLNGKIINTSEYWEYGKYSTEPLLNFIEKVAGLVRQKTGSNLFTVDTALKKDGTWTCIEIGDGQVSALPDRGNAEEFYKELLKDESQ